MARVLSEPSANMGCDELCHAHLRDAKIGLIFGLAALTMLSSLAPWASRRFLQSSAMDAVHTLAALAAGFVFGALLLLIVPESASSFTEHFTELADGDYAKEHYSDFPWAFLLVAVSFTLLVALETLVLGRGLKGQEGADVANKHVHGHVCAEDVAQAAVMAAGGVAAVVDKAKDDSAGAETSSPTEVTKAEHKQLQPKDDASDVPAKHEDVAVVVSHSHDHAGHSHGHSHGHGHGHSHGHTHAHGLTRAWFFLAALSLHSILDGLSLGANTERGTFGSIVAAIVAHKVFDGIAIGIPVFTSGMPWRQALASLAFVSAMTPVGIAIGMGATDALQGPQMYLATGIILGLSGGSFLYVGITELLPSALADGRKQGIKLLAFTAGWVSMALLAGYEGH